jgi:hypothetical protein
LPKNHPPDDPATRGNMKTTTRKASEEPRIPVGKGSLDSLISHAERASIGTLALHGLLVERDLTELARLAWLNHLEAVDVARALGVITGVEVLCD